MENIISCLRDIGENYKKKGEESKSLPIQHLVVLFAPLLIRDKHYILDAPNMLNIFNATFDMIEHSDLIFSVLLFPFLSFPFIIIILININYNKRIFSSLIINISNNNINNKEDKKERRD